MNNNNHYNTMSNSATTNYWGTSGGQMTDSNTSSGQYYPVYSSQPAYSQQTSYQQQYSQHQQPSSQYAQPAVYQTQSAVNTVSSQSSVGQYIPYIPQQQSGQYQQQVQGQYQKQEQYQPQHKQGQYQPQHKQGQYQPQQKQGQYQSQQRQGQYQQQHRQEQYKPQPQGHLYQQRTSHPAPPNNTSMIHRQGTSGNGHFSERPPANDYRELKERTVNTCREFMKGFCSKGEERCRFAHPPPFVDVKNGKVIVCFDFVKGRCNRTQPPCKYMHPPRHLWPDFGNNGGNDGAPRNARRVNDYNAGGNDQRGQSQNRDMGRMDYEARNGQPRIHQGDGPRTNEIGVCRDFLRDNCTRRDCKFAHPPPHIKVVNGRVTYCFNYLRGSCQREDCRYFHMPEHLSARYGRNEFRGQKRTYDMRDDKQDSDKLLPTECNKHDEYVPEMPRVNVVHASEAATQRSDFEAVDNVGEHCSEKEFLESAADETVMEKTLNAAEVENEKDEFEVEIEIDNEELGNSQADDDEFDKMKGDEEVENDDTGDVGDEGLLGDEGDVGDDGDVGNEGDDESYLEGPPRKRIALDTDYVEE